MNRTQAKDRARRVIASVCAYGCTIVLPITVLTASASAQSRWSSQSSNPAVAAPAATPAPAPTATAPSGTSPSAAPTTTAAPADPAPAPTNLAQQTAAAPSSQSLPPVPGLRRLPPVEQETTNPTITATTNPPSAQTAEPIDWRRPTMVMGPVPGEATPHESPVRLISNMAPAPQQQPIRTPSIATNNSVAEIIPAHTTPENGATPTETKPVVSPPVEIEPTSTEPAVTSRYASAPAPAPAVTVPTNTSKITPRYAAAAELANPAEKSLQPPADKPHFARVTDESLASPAPEDGLSPIYVCRLLGLKAAKK